ncbi:uncharacterized protein LOC130718259 [Lotus japonicus]|uniref:uncharacterized protein LOC130718259 n=1 Tax=Lotus japonicus TaxID=34305 RepID=UPI0025837B90|nr:uncharacterized protein LOC130718259 [Lotus japonicus]
MDSIDPILIAQKEEQISLTPDFHVNVAGKRDRESRDKGKTYNCANLKEGKRHFKRILGRGTATEPSRLGFDKKQVCLTEPDPCQHCCCLPDSMLFCAQPLLQSMILSAFIHTGKEGGKGVVKNVKPL